MRFLNVLLGILVYFVLINLFTWSILSALNIPYCIEYSCVPNGIIGICWLGKNILSSVD